MVKLSYKAIYRRFRPKKFEDILGQDNIKNILLNQLKNNNIAHGYIFSGIRGTGKTSLAKIFARGLNCLSPIEGEPCNNCESCKLSLEDKHMDIIEIDAASNNKVEDIREINESTNYPPTIGKQKIYIIDEVHMLSKGAFNAFLKTLEEPPQYVVFILATTEENKIPPTILSRCQRYEFKRISIEEIVKNLTNISKEIKIESEERGLELIASNSEGAMRDALSIFDKCVSSVDYRLTYDDVIECLGSLDKENISELALYILQKNMENLMGILNEITDTNKSLNTIIKDITKKFRDILILKVSEKNINNLEIDVECLDKIKSETYNISTERIIDILEKLMNIEENMRRTSQPKIAFEVGIIELIEVGRREELLDRIKALEDKFKDNSINKVYFSEDTKQDKDKIIEADFEKKEIRPEIENTGSIYNRWDEFLDFVRKNKIALYALLVEGILNKDYNEKLVIEYKEGFVFHKDAISKENNIRSLKELIFKHFKIKTEVEIRMYTKNHDELEKKDDIQKAINMFGEKNLTIE